jgi:peptidoglycan/LPS O-acetylase OafA/YrhL
MRTIEMAPRETASSAAAPVRRHDLDWLRVLAVLLLIPFHSARVFDTWDPFYVKNAETSGGLTWSVIGFLSPWHMPLLFVLAGAATWYALGHRTGAQYRGERFKRLLIPFLFGILVIVPPQAFLAARAHGHGTSFGSWLASYWSFKGDLTGYTGNWTPAHLWFIGFLFIFSLAGLPLFLRWRRRPVHARWIVFAMPLLLLVANGLPAPDDGPQNPFYSFALFVGGFLLVADERTERLIQRAWKPLLATAALTMAAVMLVWRSGVEDTWSDGSIQQVAFGFFEGVNTWVWVLALLGMGKALLDRPNRALRYANEGAYPFYLLHQSVIVAIAYAVVGWNVGLWPKYAAVLVGSFAVTLALYELVVRRTNATRFLFGLKPRRPAVTAALAEGHVPAERPVSSAPGVRAST